MELKITKRKGHTVDVEPGVSLSITGIESEEMREEVAELLGKEIPRIVERKLGEQLTLEQSTIGKKKREDDDE
ncbi:MAG: hypothetical protein JRN67_09105 [Nitrososphaerota archaeon]|nr:hypothetical protein [Nitrososphaerota archaeon]